MEPFHEMKPFHRILVATDLSPVSVPAIEESIAMAKEYGAELLIAHAYHGPSVVEAQSISSAVYEEWDRNLRAGVEEKIQPLVEEARKEGVDARPLIVEGSAHHAIAQAAKDNGADLVIMGTHGRKGVARFFMGSVAARVIASAPCPVMTVPAA